MFGLNKLRLISNPDGDLYKVITLHLRRKILHIKYLTPCNANDLFL